MAPAKHVRVRVAIIAGVCVGATSLLVAGVTGRTPEPQNRQASPEIPRGSQKPSTGGDSHPSNDASALAGRPVSASPAALSPTPERSPGPRTSAPRPPSVSGADQRSSGSGQGTPTVTSIPVRPHEVDARSFGVTCDGSSDDSEALMKAVSAARDSGDTLRLPSGTCRIVLQTHRRSLSLEGPLRMTGNGADTTLAMVGTDDGFRSLVSVNGPNVILSNLVLRRATDTPGVLVDLGPSSGFALEGVTLDGAQNRFASVCHGVRLVGNSGEQISGARILHSTIQHTSYGLLQGNTTPVSTRGFLVDGSTFRLNHADDLEFNAPRGSMSDVTVTGSVFSQNQYSDPAMHAGIAVGMANVQSATIRGNHFDGYYSAPVHVEDRSQDILIHQNRFGNSGLAGVGHSSLVFVINGSRRVTIAENSFDMRRNAAQVAGVYVGPGGNVTPPTEILIERNTFLLGSNGQATSIQQDSGVTVRNNTVKSG